jgi:hypothetical protein
MRQKVGLARPLWLGRLFDKKSDMEGRHSDSQ